MARLVDVSTFLSMRKHREKNLAVRISVEELRMLHALAEDRGEPMSALVRKWVRDAHVSRFGATKPGAK